MQARRRGATLAYAQSRRQTLFAAQASEQVGIYLQTAAKLGTACELRLHAGLRRRVGALVSKPTDAHKRRKSLTIATMVTVVTIVTVSRGVRQAPTTDDHRRRPCRAPLAAVWSAAKCCLLIGIIMYQYSILRGQNMMPQGSRKGAQVGVPAPRDGCHMPALPPCRPPCLPQCQPLRVPHPRPRSSPGPGRVRLETPRAAPRKATGRPHGGSGSIKLSRAPSPFAACKLRTPTALDAEKVVCFATWTPAVSW